jgi:branched-chain amino acid transport system ATP-binding protein
VTPLLKIDSISKRFGGIMALADVSFDVVEGEILGLIGPNGAGQNDHVQLHCRGVQAHERRYCLYPRRSSRRINGFKPEKMTELGIARTFQNIRLFNALTVLDNVRIARHCRTKSNFFGRCCAPLSRKSRGKTIVEDSMRWLDFVGLGHHAMADANSLSYGDQRRLEIARSLATEPRNCCCWMNRPRA